MYVVGIDMIADVIFLHKLEKTLVGSKKQGHRTEPLRNAAGDSNSGGSTIIK